jgi:hypothetical protein
MSITLGITSFYFNHIGYHKIKKKKRNLEVLIYLHNNIINTYLDMLAFGVHATFTYGHNTFCNFINIHSSLE